MLRKIYHIFTYCILFFIILMLADFYKQPLFLFLAMLLIALIPASYFVCKKTVSSLTPYTDITSLFGTSGDTMTLSVGLHNSSLFPLPDCTLTYEITSSFYPCNEIFQCNIPVYSHRNCSFDIPVTFRRCGCYQVRLSHITTHDYLRFFCFKKDISIQKEIVIHPKQTETVSFDSAAFGEGFDEFEENSAKGQVSSNVTDIREYIPGDRLQKIHWKLSAKIDKLMVKENEQTSSNQFTILAELYLPEQGSDILERSLTYAYSLALELLKAGEPFFFCYYIAAEEDFARHLIRSKEEFELALSDCFYQTPYSDEDLALYILERTETLKGVILHASAKGVNSIVS
nr:DUF58 domain-containing protein [Lachnospiraceae bacterium]